MKRRFLLTICPVLVSLFFHEAILGQDVAQNRPSIDQQTSGQDFVVAVSQTGYLSGPGTKLAYIVPWRKEIDSVEIRFVEVRYEYNSTEHLSSVKLKDYNDYEGLKLGAKMYQAPVLAIRVEKKEGLLGPVGLIDFSRLEKPGLYSFWVQNTEYAPFFVRKDAYLRTAYETFYYSHIQRCGCEIPGWHAACHLDDAIRSDNGQYYNAVGGWHDAGDVRKWMGATQWQAIGMIWAKQRWDVDWNQYAKDDILDELRWGNKYFHAMQDPATGLVWGDVGGDETDNHWTDNVRGTGDDRHLNTYYDPDISMQFAWTQAMASGVFIQSNKSYSDSCLRKAMTAFKACDAKFKLASQNTGTVSFGLLAVCALYKATSDVSYQRKAVEYLDVLLSRQEGGWIANQKLYRGFFYADEKKNEIFKDIWQSCRLPYALLTAAETLDGEYSARADLSLRLYFDGYILPMTRLSPFGVIPWGAVLKPNTHDFYRPLAGDLKFRIFCPEMSKLNEEKKVVWTCGNNGHILGHAAALLAASRRYGRSDYRDLALRQIEWTHGNNPLGVSTVVNRDLLPRWPHSRFVGIIPGAVTGGICGGEFDQPYYGLDYKMHYASTEYWSPLHYMYFMCICELHDDYSIATDIGVRQ